MGERVTYAELQFSKAPPGQSVIPQAQGEEPRRSIRPLPLALLAACLAQLATIIALGVCYWQQGECLEQAQAEVMQMQQEGNRSQIELQKVMGELEHARQLAQTLQQQLDTAQATMQSCQATDCCPETWMLHRGKCLFVSREEKTWEQSKHECEVNSSRLLVLQPRDHRAMPSFLAHADVPYWIGLRRREESRQWQWEDGTPYTPPGSRTSYGYFGVIKGGKVETEGRSYHRWVCERPAGGRSQGTTGTDPRA